MKNKSLKELVLQKEKEGKVVFITFDGTRTVDLEEFVRQPISGLLYDLNRDKATILSFIDDPKRNKFRVNDYAVMLTITKLKEMLEEKREL